MDYEEPLDLSPLSNHADPYEASDYSLSSSRDPSRPSSRDSGIFPNLRTPSPTLDGSQGLGINRLSASINKLSVNSTVLGDALSRIQVTKLSKYLSNLLHLRIKTLGKGSKKKSGIFQIWSDPPTPPL